MKTVPLAALLAAALMLGHLSLTAAETAKFKYVASAYLDDTGGSLKLPEGVACDGTGRIVIGDTGNDRVLRFAYKDRTLTGGSQIKIPELSAPVRVQLTAKGEIYALDGRLRRIVRLGADGDFRGVLSFTGAPPPSTVVPKSFAVDAAGKTYVLDVFSSRVLVLSAEGQFERAIALPGDTGFVTDLTIDPLGNVLLLDSLARRVYSAAGDAQSFNPLGGDLTASLTTLPTSIAASKGSIFIAEGNGGTIISLGRDGSFLSRQLTPGWKEGTLNHPAQMCINNNDEVFIADRDNSRLQVFTLIR